MGNFFAPVVRSPPRPPRTNYSNLQNDLRNYVTATRNEISKLNDRTKTAYNNNNRSSNVSNYKPNIRLTYGKVAVPVRSSDILPSTSVSASTSDRLDRAIRMPEPEEALSRFMSDDRTRKFAVDALTYTLRRIYARLQSYARLKHGQDFQGAFQEMCEELLDLLNDSKKWDVMYSYNNLTAILVANVVNQLRKRFCPDAPNARIAQIAANVWAFFRHQYFASVGKVPTSKCGSDTWVIYDKDCKFASSPYGEGIEVQATPLSVGRMPAAPYPPGMPNAYGGTRLIRRRRSRSHNKNPAKRSSKSRSKR